MSMRTPPPVAVCLRRSRVYAGFAVCITIILIAANAHSIWAQGHFSFKFLSILSLAGLCLGLLWRDVWAQPRVRELRYALGVWSVGLRGAANQPPQHGTLQVHLDLQGYILARWVGEDATMPLGPHHQTPGGDMKSIDEPIHSTPQLTSHRYEVPRRKPWSLPSAWLHLERGMVASPDEWLALRRALYAQRPGMHGVIDSETTGHVQAAAHEQSSRSS
jgi:hypothetical protein